MGNSAHNQADKAGVFDLLRDVDTRLEITNEPPSAVQPTDGALDYRESPVERFGFLVFKIDQRSS